MSQLLRKLLLLFALTATLAASPHDFEVDGIYYRITSSSANTVAVTYDDHYYSKGYNGSVIIPSSVEYNGKTYSITSIDGQAFYGCSSLTSIEIPNSVTSIRSYAFESCSSLTYVEIPSSVTSIGEKAFYGCSSLESLAFNATNCATCSSSVYPAFPSSISSLTIGDNVTRIPDYFLYNGCKIQNLTIPNSVTAIGNYAFYGCSSLESLAFNATNCATCSSSVYPAFPSSISSLTYNRKNEKYIFAKRKVQIMRFSATCNMAV